MRSFQIVSMILILGLPIAFYAGQRVVCTLANGHNEFIDKRKQRADRCLKRKTKRHAVPDKRKVADGYRQSHKLINPIVSGMCRMFKKIRRA